MSTATTAPARASAPTKQDEGGLSHRSILVILSGLMLGMFLAALDQTIVSTAIRTIADDLKGLDEQAWATTAYLITSTISTPLYGKLSDMFGRKPFFLFAISIFVVGSIACTFATSMTMLAAFRAVQGVGAGGLMSLALTIIADILPARQRAKYQGYFLAVFATSSVIGPVIGGFFAGQGSILGIDGWRWVFLVNVPIGIIALTVVAKVLNVPHQGGGRHRIDWPGAVALVLGLVPLLLVAEQGREWGWSSTAALVCYLVAAAGLLAFVLIERRYGDDALIPLKLFRSTTFSVSAGGGLLVGLAMFGGIAILPQFLQIVRGVSPTESGLLMLPFVGGMMGFSILSSQLTSRTGRYKVFPIIGTALIAVASLLFFLRLNPDIAFGELAVYMVMFGAGLGLCMQTLTLAAQNAVPARDTGVATSTVTMTRQLGGTLGTAVFLSLLFSTVGDKIAGAFRSAANTATFRAALANPSGGAESRQVAHQLTSGPNGAAGLAGQVTQDSSFLQRIDPRLAHPFLEGFTQSMTIVMLCAAIVAAAGFVVFWFMKEVPLRAVGAAQASAEEAASANVPAVSTVDTVDTVGTVAAVEESHVDGVHGAHRAPEGAVAVTGLVSAGAPLPGAVLTLIDPAGRQVARTVTGSDGRYRLYGPDTGSHVLIASAPSHRPEATAVNLTGAPVAVDVALAGSASLGGTVTSQRTGNPIAGAATTLADRRGEVVGTEHTGTDGGYAFTGLVEGEYTLVVNADEFRPSALSVSVADGARTDHDVALAGGLKLAGVARAGADAHPVGDARITLLDGSGRVVARTDTGPDGAYTFTDLPAGQYEVVASGFPPVADTLVVGGDEPRSHDVVLAYPSR